MRITHDWFLKRAREGAKWLPGRIVEARKMTVRPFFSARALGPTPREAANGRMTDKRLDKARENSFSPGSILA
jgi:hypothetical protein